MWNLTFLSAFVKPLVEYCAQALHFRKKDLLIVIEAEEEEEREQASIFKYIKDFCTQEGDSLFSTPRIYWTQFKVYKVQVWWLGKPLYAKHNELLEQIARVGDRLVITEKSSRES